MGTAGPGPGQGQAATPAARGSRQAGGREAPGHVALWGRVVRGRA